MKPRSLLVLAVVVAALGAFIWFVERDLPSTDERGERARKVVPIDADEVSALEIRVGETITRLERVAAAGGDEPAVAAAEEDLEAPAAAEWRIVQPLAARADADAVADLLDQITEMRKERTLEDVDAAGLGLAEPRATVSLVAGGGDGAEDLTLRVGDEVPASSNVIVSLAAGTDAYVVAGSFWSDLTRAPGDWRSRQAFTADRDEVTEIRLRGPAGEVHLRREEGGFVVAEPVADEASPEKVDELLAALTGLEIETFLDPPQDPAALGLEPAAATVSVRLAGDAAPIAIDLGPPLADDEALRHVSLGGQLFTADTELGELAALEPAAWRSTAWSRVEAYEVDVVEVRRGETTLRLERSEGDWLRDGVEIAYATASDLLYAVKDAEVEGLLDRAAHDLGAGPLYEIVLTADAAEETLRIYPAIGDGDDGGDRGGDGGGYPAERLGRDALLLLAADSVDEIAARLDAAHRADPLPAVDDGETAGD